MDGDSFSQLESITVDKIWQIWEWHADLVLVPKPLVSSFSSILSIFILDTLVS